MHRGEKRQNSEASDLEMTSSKETVLASSTGSLIVANQQQVNIETEAAITYVSKSSRDVKRYEISPAKEPLEPENQANEDSLKLKNLVSSLNSVKSSSMNNKSSLH